MTERRSSLAEVTVTLVFGDDATTRWEVEHVQATEALSELYTLELDVLTDEVFPDLSALLGRRVKLLVARDGCERRFHGIVRSAEDRERLPDNRWSLHISVVPELWLLSRRRDSRLFPHQDLPRIVREVLDAAGLYPGDRLVMHLATQGRDPVHAVREQCVQYQETDLDFLRRLLEEEGTTWHFAHDADHGERLVLVDGDLASSDAAFPPVLTTGGETSLQLVAPGELTLFGDEAIVRFVERTQIRSDLVTLYDDDFTRHGRQAALTQDERSRSAPSLPIYEHPGRYVLDPLAVPAGQPTEPAVLGLLASLAEDFVAGTSGGRIGGEPLRLLEGAVEETLRPVVHAPLPRHAVDTGNRLALVRMQEERSSAVVFAGEGNVTGVRAGSSFVLTGHPRHDLDRAYVVRRVVHTIHAPGHQRAAEHRAFEQRYACSFECFARDVVFRPPRVTQRPRIHGTHTATVVGGPGEEMHVDAYGRVRVQLHWDRQHACHLNAVGANESGAPPGRARDISLIAWARCAQAWAGAMWGAMFIPRVGMEVVVVFEDGDPDRPLVVGCVYNDANPPPYDLPSAYHRSTLRTRTIPSTLDPTRDGFNELRFDDLAGHEEIFLHAERDLTEVVRNHHETLVAGGQDNEVLMHQTNRVCGTQHESIGGNQQLTVGGAQTVTVVHERVVDVGGTERHASTGGSMRETRDFDAGIVRGIHLHYVCPSSAGAPDTDGGVSSVYGAIDRVLAARRNGRLIDPYTQGDHPADGAGDSAATDADDVHPIARDLALETYIVQGDRMKRIAGTEDVTVNSRGTTIAIDDRLDVLGHYGVSAGESASMVVAGGDDDESKGLSMQTDPNRLDLYFGGNGLRIVPSSLRLTRAKMCLLFDDDGVQIGCETGAVRIHLGEGTTDHGLHVEDGGDTVRLASGQGSELSVSGDIELETNGKIVLSAGSARITLANGNVEITGGSVTANGVSIGS